MWGYYLAVSIIGQSLANIFGRVVMRDARKNTWAYSALSQILTGVLIGAYALWHGFVMPPLLELWPWVVFLVILNVICNLAMYEALRTAEASLFTIFSSSRIIVSMIAAFFVLNETLTSLRLAGALLIIFAIGLALVTHFKIRREKWMLPATIYAITSGLVFIGDARVVAESDVASYMTFAFLLPGFATLMIKPKVVREMISLVRSKEIFGMLVYSFAYGIMAVTLWLAYQSGGDASQIAPIRQTAVILTVIIAITFLRERTHMYRKIVAAFLAMFAVYLITL